MNKGLFLNKKFIFSTLEVERYKRHIQIKSPLIYGHVYFVDEYIMK